MKKRKTVEDPEEEHQQHEEEEHDASTMVNGTRHKLQPDKLRQHKEEAERKDTALRSKRKRSNKDTGKRFTEGWVEFEDKRVAKRVAETLNGGPMGGRRRDAYHYDLWCLKYLKKFKWDHLTEEIAYERAVREQRMAAELRAAKKERDFYLQQVGRAKALDAIQQRKAAKAESGDEQPKMEMQVKRVYGQRAVKADPTSAGAAVLDDGLLSLVAGKV